MSSHMECPTCGHEFVVAEELIGSNIRCSNCYQWMNPFGGLLTSNYDEVETGYSSSYQTEIWEEMGYEAGYDY
jgi:transcription elongation factor Elf1